ncbi:MAG: hypothetical protein P8L98_08030, partial [Planctomycetota bacterium]|nr:hypothetical protein [Planctomycetota bacterium]
MFKNLFVSACLLCVASSSSFAAQAGQEQQASIVEDIIVVGANEEVEQALQGMSLAIGKEFSAALLEDSIEWLWSQMRMRVVQIRKLPGSAPGSIVIELLVDPLRSWKQVVFEGYDELTPPEIEVAVGLTGQTIDELELTKYEQRILDFYFEQGFRGVEV